MKIWLSMKYTEKFFQEFKWFLSCNCNRLQFIFFGCLCAYWTPLSCNHTFFTRHHLIICLSHIFTTTHIQNIRTHQFWIQFILFLFETGIVKSAVMWNTFYSVNAQIIQKKMYHRLFIQLKPTVNTHITCIPISSKSIRYSLEFSNWSHYWVEIS